MNSYYRTQAFILRKRERGEADYTVTVFTKDFGKLSLRAVSGRKIASKLRGGLELFSLSDVDFVQGKVQKTIIEARIRHRQEYVHRDVDRLRLAWRLAEVTDALVKGEERDDKIWSLLEETFSFLNRLQAQEQELRFLSYYFLWNLLDLLGYYPGADRIAQDNPAVAAAIDGFLQGDIGVLGSDAAAQVPEDLLRRVSQEHLLKVLES